MQPTTKPPYTATWHPDGTLSWWSVYRQQWQRTDPEGVPARELAAMDPETRDRVRGTVEKETK